MDLLIEAHESFRGHGIAGPALPWRHGRTGLPGYARSVRRVLPATGALLVLFSACGCFPSTARLWDWAHGRPAIPRGKTRDGVIFSLAAGTDYPRGHYAFRHGALTPTTQRGWPMLRSMFQPHVHRSFAPLGGLGAGLSGAVFLLGAVLHARHGYPYFRVVHRWEEGRSVHVVYRQDRWNQPMKQVGELRLRPARPLSRRRRIVAALLTPLTVIWDVLADFTYRPLLQLH